MSARRPNSLNRSRLHSRRGSVILFVLGVIFLTAFLLTRFIDRAGGELLAEAKASSRAPLREEAYSTLEASLGVLASVSTTDSGLHSPEQGWKTPLAYTTQLPDKGFVTKVEVLDESGKLSLPKIDPPLLQRYLETLGCSKTDGEKVVDALMAWTRSDYSAVTNEADPHQYEGSSLPYAPPQRPLRSWEELRAIKVTRALFFDEQGQWNELGRAFCENLSLHSFTPVNVNTAPTVVLVALGMDPSQSDVVERARADPHTKRYFPSVPEASAAWGTDLTRLPVGADATCLRLRITVNQGSRIFRLEAVVVPGNTAAQTAGQGQAAAPAANATAGDAAKSTEGTTAVRSWSRNRIDYPFTILELREDSGS